MPAPGWKYYASLFAGVSGFPVFCYWYYSLPSVVDRYVSYFSWGLHLFSLIVIHDVKMIHAYIFAVFFVLSIQSSNSQDPRSSQFFHKKEDTPLPRYASYEHTPQVLELNGCAVKGGSGFVKI